MIGFRVKHNGQFLYVALLKGVTGVTIENGTGNFCINVSGLDSPDIHYKWFHFDLKEGDEIEITLEEIDAAQVSKCMVYDWSKPDERAADLLMQYREEKRRLAEMGLL